MPRDRWRPPDLQLGEGDDKLMLPYCDKWIHIAFAAIYRLCGKDPEHYLVYRQAVEWVDQQVASIQAQTMPIERTWNF